LYAGAVISVSGAVHTQRLLESSGSREGAFQAAVGPPEEYVTVGKLEKSLLMYAGLRPDNCFLDVEAVAQHLGFDLIEVHRSDEPFFP
jgi:hypothetical protein